MEKWPPPKAAKKFGVKNPKIKESCGSGASPVGAARPKASPVGARPVGAPEAEDTMCTTNIEAPLELLSTP